ncbi:MAG: hypothetical protein ACI959_001046, partial [Limisphaerales bacterium]
MRNGLEKGGQKRVTLHCYSYSAFNLYTMKSFLVIAALLISSGLFAQVETPYPIDTNTNLISYQGVVEIDGYDKSQLYDKGIEWVKTHYKDPGGFFTLKEKEKGKIEGKHRIALWKTIDGQTIRSGQMVKYTMTMWFKDGKYRYKITR